MIGNNNPLNIRYSSSNNWLGQIGQTKGFCDFKELKYCYRAALLIFRSYRNRGVETYEEIIYAYAPPSENNTANYVGYVTKRLGVFPFDVPRSLLDFASLIHYMCFFEGNTCSSVDFVYDSLKSLGYKKF